ncbi:hypothetical protein QTP88_001438 [Uroleucon formosanum]
MLRIGEVIDKQSTRFFHEFVHLFVVFSLQRTVFNAFLPLPRRTGRISDGLLFCLRNQKITVLCLLIG